MTTLPLDFPPLVAAAEEMAREHHTALVAAMARLDRAVSFTLTVPPALVAAQAALLADLRRPLSRAFWREWLGARLNLDVTGGIVFTPTAHRRAKVRDWIVEDWNGATGVVLTASRITDPAAALRLAVMTAAGRDPAKE